MSQDETHPVASARHAATNEALRRAIDIRHKAYAPYSLFQVGAAVIDDRGQVFAGVNVENSSYGATICAERNAIAAMVAGGGRKFAELVVVTSSPKGWPPCGMCRQVLAEFAVDMDQARVHVANEGGIVTTYRLRDLLPEAFDSSYLARR